jgi:hypothetical protein
MANNQKNINSLKTKCTSYTDKTINGIDRKFGMKAARG